MDLAGLKWTKNVKPNDKDWAYDNTDSDLRIFCFIGEIVIRRMLTNQRKVN